MKIFRLARERLGVIAGVIGDVQAKVIAVLLYWTAVLPFGLVYRFTGDPLRRKLPSNTSYWMDREAVSTELTQAQKQG